MINNSESKIDLDEEILDIKEASNKKDIFVKELKAKYDNLIKNKPSYLIVPFALYKIPLPYCDWFPIIF